MENMIIFEHNIATLDLTLKDAIISPLSLKLLTSLLKSQNIVTPGSLP